MAEKENVENTSHQLNPGLNDIKKENSTQNLSTAINIC